MPLVASRLVLNGAEFVMNAEQKMLSFDVRYIQPAK